MLIKYFAWKNYLGQVTGSSCLGGNYFEDNYPGDNYPGTICNYPGGNCPGGNYPGENWPRILERVESYFLPKVIKKSYDI